MLVLGRVTGSPDIPQHVSWDPCAEKNIDSEVPVAQVEDLVLQNDAAETRKNQCVQNDKKLGGGFKYFLFSPLFGEDFQFDWYFSDGLKPPTRKQRDELH